METMAKLITWAFLTCMFTSLRANGNSTETFNVVPYVSTPSFSQESSSLMTPSAYSSNTDNLHLIYNKVRFIQDMFLFPIICPIGIIGNFVVARHLFSKKLSNSSFIYMVVILVADGLSLITDMILPVARLIGYDESKLMLKISAFLYFWASDVFSLIFRRISLNVFCVLSYERLTAIKRPFDLHKSITVSHPSLFFVGSIILAFLVTIVTALFTTMAETFDTVTSSTVYRHSYTELYFENPKLFDIVMIISRLLDSPFQIVVFSIINVQIVKVLYNNKKDVKRLNNQDRLKSISKLQTRLCKIFLILSATNTVAFMPYSLVVVIAKLFPDLGLRITDSRTLIILFGMSFLRVLNSLTDFLVFLIVAKDTRKEIMEKYSMICLKGKSNEEKNTSERCSTEGTNTHM